MRTFRNRLSRSQHTTVPIRNRPILTEVFENIRTFMPEDHSAYIYAWSMEERSHHTRPFKGRQITLIPISSQDASVIEIKNLSSGKDISVQLRSERQLRGIWTDAGHQTVYIDITGLSHHVWAPLLRSAIAANRRVRVVYVEPGEYTLSATPTEGAIFDLSERISGVRPIPGFACLADEDDDFCFVPLLGFEGPRFAYLLEQVQPRGGKIFPIVGVPGFRPEYPYFTYQGNRLPLLDSLSWRNVRYAAANCPFSLYYTLEDIAEENPFDSLKIAPIGTKPHALGAVLFSLTRPRSVELVYDHPIRKASRTSGTARLLVYYVSGLFLDTARS